MAICSTCGWWERICHCKELNLFSTPKDKLWEFVDTKNFRHPVEVHGKRHWKSLMKQHGLIDDVDLKYKPQRYEPLKREFIRDQISSELQQKGLYDKLVKRRR